jgi:AcrR family transcriptional regulator
MANAGYLQAPERRRVILESARRVFARRGYHDTNISHICDDLGIARGTLYLHFKSKEDVFAAIVQDLLDRVREAVEHEPRIEIPRGVRIRREDVVAYCARSIRRILGAVFADEESLRIIVRGGAGVDVRVDKILAAIDAITVERFATDLEAAQKLGVLRADFDPKVAALFALGGIEKVALRALAERKGKIDLDTLAAEAASIELLGLLAKEVKP